MESVLTTGVLVINPMQPASSVQNTNVFICEKKARSLKSTLIGIYEHHKRFKVKRHADF